MDGNLDYTALDALGKKPGKTQQKKDDPAAREKILRAARLAKNYGFDIPDDVADDFYELTALESGRAHYLADGKTVKTGARTPNGDIAIGYSQVMGNTAKPYKEKKLDPYKEDDNLIIGLNEFYKGDPQDPIARRLAYVGGTKSPALAEYRRTGKVSDAKLYSYLPNNKETYADYVNNSGAYRTLDDLADAPDFSALDRLGNTSDLDTLGKSDFSALDALGGDMPAPQPDILANLSAQKTQLETDLKAEKSPVKRREIRRSLLKLDASIKQTASEQNSGVRGNILADETPFTPNVSPIEPTPRISALELPEEARTDIESLGKLDKSKIGETDFDWQNLNQPVTLTDKDGKTWIESGSGIGLQPNQKRVVGDDGSVKLAEKTTDKNGKESWSMRDEVQSPNSQRRVARNQAAQNAQTNLQADNSSFQTTDPTPEQLAAASSQFTADADYQQTEIERQEREKQKFFAERPSVEAKTNADILTKGSAGTFSIDLTQKPKDVAAGDYLDFQAIKQAGAQFGGFTDEEVRTFLNAHPDTTSFKNLTDAQIKAQAKRDGKFVVDVPVVNSAVNEILQRRTGGDINEINSELRTKIGLEENTLSGGLEKNQNNIADFRARDEAERRTRSELANPTTSDLTEKSLQRGLSSAGNFLVSPVYGLYKELQNSVADIENTFKSDDERVNKQLEDIRSQYGGDFVEYQKTRDYYKQMSAPETISRMVMQTGRSAVKTAISDVLKGADFLDSLNENYNPLIAFLPDSVKPSLRNLGNGLGYAIAYLKNPQTAKNLQFVKSSDDADKRLFYNIGKYIDDELGEDKYLKDRFLGQLSDGAGSGIGFMLMGFVAPEASLTTRLGEFSLSSAGLGAVTSAGSGYDEAKRQGLTEEQAKANGAINGLLGLTEGFGIGASMNRAIKNATLRKVVLSELLDWAKQSGGKVFKGGAEEALQEFFQSTGGRVAMDALKDKDPSSYQRVLNIIKRLPSQAAETLVKDVPVAAITGGAFEGAAHLAAGEASNNPRVDFKNNIIEVEGERFSFTDESKSTVQSWVNQQSGIEAVYSEIADLQKQAKSAKTSEEKAAILKRTYELGREANILAKRDIALMEEIQKDLTPLAESSNTESASSETQHVETLSDNNLSDNPELANVPELDALGESSTNAESTSLTPGEAFEKAPSETSEKTETPKQFVETEIKGKTKRGEVVGERGNQYVVEFEDGSKTFVAKNKAKIIDEISSSDSENSNKILEPKSELLEQSPETSTNTALVEDETIRDGKRDLREKQSATVPAFEAAASPNESIEELDALGSQPAAANESAADAAENALALSPVRQKVRAKAAELFGGQTISPDGAFPSFSSSALNKIADSATDADIQTQAELRADPAKMQMLPEVQSERRGDEVKVSLHAGEVLRVASAIISGEGVNDVSLSGGLYLDKQDVANYTEALDEIGNLAEENGQSRTQVDKLKTDILEAAKENGSAIINIYDNALPHERIHQGSDLGSQTDEGLPVDYIERYASPETIENDADFQTFRTALNKIENRVLPTGAAIEEAFAYLGAGQHEQFGLTENQAVALLQKIVLSYVEKNGVESLKAFDKTEIQKTYESIEQSKKQNAAAESGNQNGSLESGGGIGRRGQGGQQSSGAESAANDEGEQSEVNYFETKSDDATTWAAQDKIERVGLSSAFAEALNPNIKQTSEHVALQIETIKLFNRQAKEANEANNKTVSTAKLNSALDILLSVPFDGIHAGAFVDELAAIGQTSAEALPKYVESLRSAEGNADLLTEGERSQLQKDAEKLNALNARLDALTNKNADSTALKQALKMALPSISAAVESSQSESEMEAAKIRKQRAVAQRQLLNRIRFLQSRTGSYMARTARIYKALLVSAVQTTVNNVLTAEGTRKIENLSDLAEVAINKTLAAVSLEYEYKGKIGSDTRFQDIFHLPEREDYTAADVAKHFFTDAIFARSIAVSVLEEYPALYESMFGTYASDVDVMGEGGGTSLPDRAMKIVEKGVEHVNVLNRVQEFLVRSQEFNYALQLRLGQKGLNLADVIKNKQIVRHITEADLTFAINRALRVTFALKPETDTLFGGLIDLYQQKTPAILSPFLTTFPNFMYNATKFVTDYAPVIGVAKAGIRGARPTNSFKEEVNPRVAAQQLVGTAMFLSALALVRSVGDDDKWYYLRVPQTKYYIDVRPYQPFASMVFLANKANRAIDGKPVFTDRDTAIAETLEALTGLSTRNLTENKIGQILWRGTLGRENDGKDWERVAYLAKQQLGEIGGGILRPLKTLKDLVAQFDEYERTIPNTINRPGSQGIARSLPFANRILQLEGRKDFVTGNESKQTAPGLKIFGVTLVNPDMHKEVPSQAFLMLKEITDNFQTEKDILPEAQEKAAVKSSIYRAMRAANGESEKEKAVQEAIRRAENLGILKAGEIEYINRQEKLTALQSMAKRVDLPKLERVLQVATDSEKESLAPVIEAKKETLEKKEEREATEQFTNQVRRGEVSFEDAEKSLDAQLKDGKIDEKEYVKQIESFYQSEAEAEVKKLNAVSAADFAKIEKLVLTLNPEDREGVYNQLIKKIENKLKEKDAKSDKEAMRLMEIVESSFSDFEKKK